MNTDDLATLLAEPPVSSAPVIAPAPSAEAAAPAPILLQPPPGVQAEPVVVPVRLLNTITQPAGVPSKPWPVGYTMTVWGVAIGATVLAALAITTWLRMSAHARAFTIQSVTWRLTPRQVLALLSVSRKSGTPASVMLVSRGALDSAVSGCISGESGSLTPSAQHSLAALSQRVFGPAAA